MTLRYEEASIMSIFYTNCSNAKHIMSLKLTVIHIIQSNEQLINEIYQPMLEN